MLEVILKVLFFIILLLYMYFENKFLTVTHYSVISSKIPKEFEGVNIILLADLHNNYFGKDNSRLLEAIEKEKPDYIMIAGDMIVGNLTSSDEIALNFIKELANKYQVYYSTGNHEQRLGIYPETKNTRYLSYINELKKLGVHLLINEQETIIRDGNSLTITGLQIHEDFYKKIKRPKMEHDYIEKELGFSDKNTYNILLAHNPMYFPAYANWGADLVLSGHVHGGIVRLPFLGGVISPQYQLFPKYDGGKFLLNEKTMILSRGLGTHTIKLRLFNKPEVVVIKLKRKDT